LNFAATTTHTAGKNNNSFKGKKVGKIDIQVSFLDFAHLSLLARPIIIKTTPHPRKPRKAELTVNIRLITSPIRQIPRIEKTL